MKEANIKRLSELKLKLGKNLTDKLDNFREKYGNKGFKVGITLGTITGAVIGHFSSNEADMPLYTGFIGCWFGANMGYLFGLKYGEYKINSLKKEFSGSEKDIQEYTDLKKKEMILKKLIGN
jgi:hypothetical protein